MLFEKAIRQVRRSLSSVTRPETKCNASVCHLDSSAAHFFDYSNNVYIFSSFRLSLIPSVYRPSVRPFVRQLFHSLVRPSVRPFVLLSVSPSVSPFVRSSCCSFVRQSFRLFVCPFVRLSISHSVGSSVRLSFCSSILPSVRPSLLLCVLPFVRRSFHPFVLPPSLYPIPRCNSHFFRSDSSSSLPLVP